MVWMHRQSAEKSNGRRFVPKERELSKEEYFRLLEAAKENRNTRLYLLMQTLCATGIRVSELPFYHGGGRSVWAGHRQRKAKPKNPAHCRPTPGAEPLYQRGA